MQLWSGRNCQRSSREFFVEIQHSSVIWAVFPGIKITGPCAFYELRQRRTADIDFVQIFRTTFHFTMARNEKWKAESLFFPPSLALVFCLLNICAALFCWHFFFLAFSSWFCCCSENKSGALQTMLQSDCRETCCDFRRPTRPPVGNPPIHQAIQPSIRM